MRDGAKAAVCLNVAALQFLRRNDDVSADLEEMETEMQESDKNPASREYDDSSKQAVSREEAVSLKKDGETGKKDVEEKFTMSRLLHSRQLRLPLFIAMFLQVIQQLSGINAVMLSWCCLQ